MQLGEADRAGLLRIERAEALLDLLAERGRVDSRRGQRAAQQRHRYLPRAPEPRAADPVDQAAALDPRLREPQDEQGRVDDLGAGVRHGARLERPAACAAGSWYWMCGRPGRVAMDCMAAAEKDNRGAQTMMAPPSNLRGSHRECPLAKATEIAHNHSLSAPKGLANRPPLPPSLPNACEIFTKAGPMVSRSTFTH